MTVLVINYNNDHFMGKTFFINGFSLENELNCEDIEEENNRIIFYGPSKKSCLQQLISYKNKLHGSERVKLDFLIKEIC